MLDGYRLNECLIVAEHNLVSNVSTSQVAEEWAKEAKLSDCSYLHQDYTVLMKVAK